MRIAIASGKGGTGKTFVATNLFRVAEGAALADLDVEGANDAVFLDPDIVGGADVTIDVPIVDKDKCTRCGRCAAACRFNALAVAGMAGVMVFNELCHSCGVCQAVCPAGAVSTVPHPVGRVRHGLAFGRAFADGDLAIGQVRSTAVIRRVRQEVAAVEHQLWDCPPGTACATREAVDGADACLLVTEATPFGLHDLDLALSLAGTLRIPSAVVINRDGLGEADVDAFCRERGVPIAARIPFRREVAACYAAGRLAVDEAAEYRAIFERLSRDLFAGSIPFAVPSHDAPTKRPDLSGEGDGQQRGAPPVRPAADGAEDGLCRIVVVSGKGGTGKTTLTAALADAMARDAGGVGPAALADCDVDAANLSLALGAPPSGDVQPFTSGFVAEIDPSLCQGCTACARACRFDAIRMTPKAEVDPLRCEGCGLCEIVCPLGQAGDENPVQMHAALSGELGRAASRCGPLARGTLWAGGESSGKLVVAVRDLADAAARESDGPSVLIDGPPGTGCPVNASVTGTDLAVVVTEPTRSALHDLERILDLLALFHTPAFVVINKVDLDEQLADAMERRCADRAAKVVGRIPFDRAVLDAVAAGRSAASLEGAAGRAFQRAANEIINHMVTKTGRRA